MDEYDKAKKDAEKRKQKKQNECPHEVLDEIVFYKRCLNCNAHKAFREPADIEKRGVTGKGPDWT